MEGGSSVLFYRKHGYGAGEYHQDKKLQSFYENEEEQKGKINALDHLKNTLSLIENINIDEQHQEDKEQIELLHKKKEQARQMIRVVLRKTGEYLEIIARMKNLEARKEEYEPSAYRKMFMEIDQLRKIKHEALMSDINIANRFMMKNFGKASDEVIEMWGNEEIEAGRQMLFARRIDFPKNIICPDDIDLNDRNQIRRWAVQIGGYLSELKNGL